MTQPKSTAHFWFDPACPYTWITSEWLREVARVRPVEVRWRVMSLSVLNEGRESDPEGDTEGFLGVAVRVCAAVVQGYGKEALGRFYGVLGERIHKQREWDWRRLFPAALEAAGLPAQLAEAGGSTRYDAAVRASHNEAVALVGPDVGTPVMGVENPLTAGFSEIGESAGEAPRALAFFGPCVSPAPRGEQAGRLWDGALLMASVAQFYEFKRSAVDTDYG